MSTNTEVRKSGTWCSAVIVAMLVAGCASGNDIHVRTAEAPDANFSHATSYRFLRQSASTPATTKNPDGTITNTATGEVVSPNNPAEAENPTIESPITRRHMRDDIERLMTDRGYHLQPTNPDLSIAYYIGVRERLEVNNYNYGYPFWGWDWKWGPGWNNLPEQHVTSYEQGTVIVDVLDAGGRRLLWRGTGQMTIPNKQEEYEQAIAKTVRAVMARFPGRAA